MGLREFDECLKLTAGLKGLVADERDRRYIEHSALNLLCQRIYQIAAGYEDANDATFLRRDPTLRAVVGRGELPPATQPTCIAHRLSKASNELSCLFPIALFK